MSITTLSSKMQLAFLMAGLLVGVLIALPLAWSLKPPQSPPAPLKIVSKLSEDELLARLGKPNSVNQPSAQTGGYTVAQFESFDRDVGGTPKWAVQVYLK